MSPHDKDPQSRAVKEDALRKFNLSFSLMTIIPLLFCFYFITIRFLSINIFAGLNGAYFAVIISIALLGLVYGRGVVLKIVDSLMEMNKELHYLMRQEEEINKKLVNEILEREKAQSRLKATQDQLVQAEKLESIGVLAVGTAHEVKNPLAVISMGIDYLKESINGSDKDAQVVIGRMESAIKRADDIIIGLLDYSTQSQLTLKPEDMPHVLEESLLLVKHELDKNQIEVIKDFSSILPQVNCDKRRIQQVFVNLISNAVAAMAKGGQLAVRSYAATKSDIAIRDTGFDPERVTGSEFLVTEIIDSGNGIPEENLLKIFDPFFTTKRDRGGTGLGLSIIRNIVESHKGFIRIFNNKESRGVTALLALPIKTGGK